MMNGAFVHGTFHTRTVLHFIQSIESFPSTSSPLFFHRDTAALRQFSNTVYSWANPSTSHTSLTVGVTVASRFFVYVLYLPVIGQYLSAGFRPTHIPLTVQMCRFFCQDKIWPIGKLSCRKWEPAISQILSWQKMTYLHR